MPTKSASLNRRALHNFLRKQTLDGSMLDIGGTKNGKYQKEIRGEHTFTVVNIDEAYGYDLQFNVEEPFPIGNESYDHIVCVNVLEHIYNYPNVIQESFRTLKSGGTIVHFTPFLNPIHGTPYDFFRYTQTCLEKMYADAGFEIMTCEQAHAGMLCCIYQYSYPLLPTFLCGLWRISLESTESILQKISSKYRKYSENFVLAYQLVAQKP